MTEELDDEKRTWYLKGYAQAEADQEVLIKKLMKDINDLNAEKEGLTMRITRGVELANSYIEELENK